MTDDWEQRACALPPGDREAVLAFVREQLETGDISTRLVHHLAMTSGVDGDVAGLIERERIRWFRKRGRSAPVMPGPVGLE